MEGYIGNYNQNPFVFLPFSLSFIAYSIDGGCTPYIPLQPRFVSHKYQDSDFVQIYSTLFVDHLSPDITPEKFVESLNLYLFEISRIRKETKYPKTRFSRLWIDLSEALVALNYTCNVW